jgi:hypothetical protein
VRHGKGGGGGSCGFCQGWQGVQSDKIGRGYEASMQSGCAMLGESESVLLALHRLSGGDKGASGCGFAEWVICGGCPSCEFAHIFWCVGFCLG